MRLLDQIAETTCPLIIEQAKLGRQYKLQSVTDFKQRLFVTPLRYVLDESATKLCAEVALNDARLLNRSLDILRLPADRLWIEWDDFSRYEVLSTLRPDLKSQAAPKKGAKAGALIEGSSGGRQGHVWIFGSDGSTVDFLPLRLSFDTDLELLPSPTTARKTSFRIDHSQFPELNGLLRHCLASIEEDWAAYYADVLPPDKKGELISGLAAQIWFDWPFLTSFFMLQMAGGAVEERTVNQQKLNVDRSKKGRHPLLDHVEITRSILPLAKDAYLKSNNVMRSPARLHFVKGHLVRRASKVFWRSPHFRGNAAQGVVQTKTVNFTGPR